MENKPQVKSEPQEASEPEPQKKENSNNTEDTPPAKKECHGKTKNLQIIETTILPPPPPLQANLFFELFYDGPYDLTLFNRSWGIHRVPPPNRAIVLSEMTLLDMSLPPSYKKKVILTESLTFKAFVLDKLVVEKKLDKDNTKEDFEDSFVEILNMMVCKGGPSVKDIEDLELMKFAYKDYYSNRWRHKSCTIIIERPDACRPCTYLEKYFQEWLKYNSKDKQL
ncbi:uncharacterized protein LOC106640618 [Copidosoma floridanum]|uniref:uncharacterized protein LOC106640618 n=1 Tax=Copidosoma floridanum TaxID=29053 RepID=UPI0006C9991E|nr:uncharacterized protein LOC106640618 [Copidosoma floridanum]